MSNPLANKIRTLVSKNKKRWKKDGFDLDLSYIEDNIIAMGFPAQSFEGYYRNHIDHVEKFLDEYHHNSYMVYNLCKERTYENSCFDGKFICFQFEDHNPPPLELIADFCEHVHKWLLKDPKNIAVIHCKAGKGRTGVMIGAYLIFKSKDSPEPWTADRALRHYGEQRTEDRKGVTIPSQVRYVHYYDYLLKHGGIEKYTRNFLLLKGIKFITVPKITSFNPQLCIYQDTINRTTIFESESLDCKKLEHEICFEFKLDHIVSGDIMIAVYNYSTRAIKKRLFQFWFNTFLVSEGYHTYKPQAVQDSDRRCSMTDRPDKNGTSTTKVRVASSFTFDHSKCLTLHLKKHELDKANKDKTHNLFLANFEVVCYFSHSDALPDSARTQVDFARPSRTPVENNHPHQAGAHSHVEYRDSDDNLSDNESLEQSKPNSSDPPLAGLQTLV